MTRKNLETPKPRYMDFDIHASESDAAMDEILSTPADSESAVSLVVIPSHGSKKPIRTRLPDGTYVEGTPDWFSPKSGPCPKEPK